MVLLLQPGSVTYNDITATGTVLYTDLAKGPSQVFIVGPVRREHKTSGTFYAFEQRMCPAQGELHHKNCKGGQRFPYGHEW